MAAGEIHVGDTGTAFVYTVKDENGTVVPLNGSTSKQVVFQKPTEGTTTVTPSFFTDGTDGKLLYISESGFLSEKGQWRSQGIVNVSGVGPLYSDIKTFQVFPNLG